MSPVTVVFLRISQNFQNSYVKEQLYFHAVGTIQEMDELLKDLLIHNTKLFSSS